MADFAQSLHAQCLSNTPSGSAQDIVKAMVCADPLSEKQFQNIFYRSSLFHIIVVSKTHFNIIAAVVALFLNKLRPKVGFGIGFLLSLFYALMCNLQAPLVRTLVSIGLSRLNSNYKLFLSQIKILMLSAILCLGLNPLWIDSLSLLHSVSCALAFVLVSKINLDSATKHFLAYILTLPFLYGWGSLHPTGIIINIIVTPLLVISLVPFSFLVFFIHPLMPLFDRYVDFIFGCLNIILDSVTTPTATYHIPSWILWSLFWSASLCADLFHRIKKRFVHNITTEVQI